MTTIRNDLLVDALQDLGLSETASTAIANTYPDGRGLENASERALVQLGATRTQALRVAAAFGVVRVCDAACRARVEPKSITSEPTTDNTPDEAPQMPPAHRFVYSLDGSEFRGDEADDNKGWESRDQALAAGRKRAASIARLKDEKPGSVWTGVKVHYSANAFFPEYSTFIEHMADSADGEVGSEAAGDWPAVYDAAQVELQSFIEDKVWPFLDAWAEKHDLQPSFWGVTEVVKHADDDGALATT